MDGIVAAVAVGILVLGLGFWWFLRHRSPAATSPSRSVAVRPRGRVDALQGPGAASNNVLSPEEAEVLLMALGDPTYPDVYVAMGPTQAIDRLGGERLAFLHNTGTAVADANLVVHGINAYQQATTTIVTFSRETTALLDGGAKLMQGASGLKLGTVVDPSTGKIIAQAQFVTQSAANLTSAAASMGVAVSLAVIQMQLNAISKQLEEVTRKVDRIAERQQIAQVSSLVSTVRTIDDVRQKVLAGGRATDRLMTEINGQGRDLATHITQLTEQTRLRLKRLGRVKGQEARLKWLRDEGQSAVQDICLLVLATRGWAMYQTLGIANLLAPGDEANQATHAVAAQKAATQMRERLTEVYTVTVEMAYELDRVLQLAALAPGRITFREKATDKVAHVTLTRDQTKDLASALRDMLATADLPIPKTPGIPTQVTHIGTPRAPHDWRDHVGALLGRDERVQGVVHGLGAGGSHTLDSSPSVVLITDQRVIGLRQGRFMETGMLAFSCPNGSIKYAEVSTAYRQTVLRFRLKSGLHIFRDGDAVDINLPADEAKAAKSLFDKVRLGPLPNPEPQGPIIQVDGVNVLRSRPVQSPMTIQASKDTKTAPREPLDGGSL